MVRLAGIGIGLTSLLASSRSERSLESTPDDPKRRIVCTKLGHEILKLSLLAKTNRGIASGRIRFSPLLSETMARERTAAWPPPSAKQRIGWFSYVQAASQRSCIKTVKND
jgi:hypothetical protein